MTNYTDLLIDDVRSSTEYTYNYLINSLIAFRKQLDNVGTYFSENGNTFLTYTFLSNYFKFINESRQDLFSLIVSPCIAANKITDPYRLYYEVDATVQMVLTGIIAGGESGLYTGQTVYNASACTEYSIHYEHQEFEFNNDGSVDPNKDHGCAHTGPGIPGADFKMKADFLLNVVDAKEDSSKTIVLKAGDLVDAKDYKSTKTMEEAFKANTNGALGHYGKWLICHIIGTKDEFYIAENKQNSPYYKISGFNMRPERPQVRLKTYPGLGTAQFLLVNYF